MKFVIETLEIELARLKRAIRVFYSTTVTYADTQDGYPADIRGMERNVRQLEKGIEILKEWQAAHKDEIPLEWE